MIKENQRLIRTRDNDDELTCIVCPIGCRMRVETADDGEVTVEGNRCKRGAAYASEEFRDPRRVITGTCAIAGSALTRLPVRSAVGVPIADLAPFLKAMYDLRLQAPVDRGTVLAVNLGDTGVDLVATMTVEEVHE